VHDLREAMDAEYRRQLLRINRERIEVACLKARHRGLLDALILVLDLQDARAAELAHSTGLPWPQIEQAREDCARDDVVPVLVLATSPNAVSCLVNGSASRGSKVIAQPPPPETFRVVVVASGGSAFSDFPLPPGSPDDREGELM